MWQAVTNVLFKLKHMPLFGSAREDINRSFSCFFVGGWYVFKWIHLKHKPQWTLKAASVVIKKVGGMQGGFGGGLDLQTEIVTDSHRTICANDMFQSVSLQYSELFAWGLLACITAFICSNLLVYHTETAEENYFHNVIQPATSRRAFIQIKYNLFAIFAIFNNVFSQRLSLIFHARNSQHQYENII